MALPRRVLVANRGEIAVRVMRAAATLGIEHVAVATPDDIEQVHARRADRVAPLTADLGYLDVAALVRAAVDTGCDAVHPGYGFLAEDPAFARALEGAGLAFVGPSPEVLDRLGDKVAARALAIDEGIPVLAAIDVADDTGAVASFVATHGGAMLKAVSGGGGRGMRAVHPGADVDALVRAARSEAVAVSGDGALFAEQLASNARHIEVQVLGDGTDVRAVGLRDCSIQRRHQKVIEFAPPAIAGDVHDALVDASERLLRCVCYRGAGTVEFLVAEDRWWFLEVNPRIQVEHPVTEESTGLDLVAAQFRLLDESVDEVCRESSPTGGAFVVEARVYAESIRSDGSVVAHAGTIDRFEPPSGPGVRVDHAIGAGSTVSGRYDPLLAKVIVRGSTFDGALARLGGALGELVIEGVGTNIGFLRRVLAAIDDPAQITTAFVGDRLDALADADHQQIGPVADRGVLASPVTGTVARVEVAAGDAIAAGQTVVVVEAMKMEHLVVAPGAGTVAAVEVDAGTTVQEGAVLLRVRLDDGDSGTRDRGAAVDLDRVRPDLAEVLERHQVGLDDRRPDAVARRRRTGHRTARENIAHLVDEGSLVEYGPLAIAAQRKRRSLEDLIERTPGDGLVGGIATIGGKPVAVASYDYTVLAGTQGLRNHQKKDRLFSIAAEQRLPFVLFAEGGGGRPGDTDGTGVAGLDGPAFLYWARLSGVVPMVGVASGRCFAGNAALLGCCDVVIATADANIGMGGPAMIEGGGLGVFRPEDVGPTSDQVPSGVIDLLVTDEAEAVSVARRYLDYFLRPMLEADEWTVGDQRLLRHVIPENRLQVYDVRPVVDALFDDGSVLELRSGFAPGMITAFARVEGRAVGVVANNPMHLAGAIDSDGADKASRFLQLCDAFDVPVVFLVDTPGIMVGPDAERTALVRHAARLFVTGAGITVPHCAIVLRKGYGLGAMAMTGGSFHAGAFCVGWPTSEFGGMGLEGAVRLGYRAELDACVTDEERDALYDELVARLYEVGKGVNMAAHLEIDDVIDPADSRRWIATAMLAASPPPARTGGKRPNIDTW